MIINKRLSIGRYKQIMAVFAKHGFGFLLDQIGITRYLNIRKSSSSKYSGHLKLSTGERLRLSLEELGTTFIKLGQILSTRRDLFSPEIIAELTKLQHSVKSFPFPEVKSIIESEFADKLENIFVKFEQTPIASASISQVHCAKTVSGKNVAIKVRRPGIEKSIAVDILILKDLAHFIDNHTKFGNIYNFTEMVNEFEIIFTNELDFTQEAENANRFQENFFKDTGYRVPKIEWIYTTKKILTMEFIEGARIDNIPLIKSYKLDTNALAFKLTESILNQILRDGFFHADPHPGNILVQEDGTIVFLDLGMVVNISESRKIILSNFFIAIVTKNSRAVVRAIIDLSSSPKKRGLRSFERDIGNVIDKYLMLPWSQINLNALLSEIFNIAFLNHIKIPHEFALISKVMGTLQNILETLAPDLNTFVVAKPIAQKLFYQSFSMKRIGNEFKRSLLDYNDLFRELPYYMIDFLDKMEQGDFKFQVDIKEIFNIQKKLDKIFNRISFSLILLALSIIIAGIIIGSSMSAGIGNEMYLLNVKVLKVGLVIVVVSIVGLIISIIRSNLL